MTLTISQEIYDAVGQLKKVRSEQGFGALGNIGVNKHGETCPALQ